MSLAGLPFGHSALSGLAVWRLYRPSVILSVGGCSLSWVGGVFDSHTHPPSSLLGTLAILKLTSSTAMMDCIPPKP